MKDAKGHGSNPRGGATGKNSPDEERLFNNLMAKTAQGGEEKNFAGLMQRATNPASDAQAASQLGQGHPKSEPVPVHPGAAGRTYTGTVKVGNKYVDTGGHPTREAAHDAARALNPKAKTVSTGYGYKGGFDIRWHDK